MTDLHTHILPLMDDGARSLEESLAMLEMERSHGVDTVILTPHFYRQRETVEDFLQRRQQSLDMLLPALTEDSPKLMVGAEVAWFSSLAEEPQLHKLCIGDTKYILLELPYATWSKYLLDQVYQFANNSGLIPILAHVERYLPLQKREQVGALLDMGLPMQMSADAFANPFSRHKMLDMLKWGQWYIGTDCHNIDKRKPNMDIAAKALQKRLPGPVAQGMLTWQPV